MALSTYKEKRDFKSTTEPEGDKSRIINGLPIFTIQRHDARALHFDLRLEYNGILLSWAITKKPIRNKNIKRLAVHVEDHPLDYANFSGLIPEGNYGAGIVEIWDSGTYLLDGCNNKKQNEKLLNEKLKKGHFVFNLNGSRLKGKFVLVKLGKQENNWLLYYDADDAQEKDESDDPQYFGFIKPMIPTLIENPFNDNDWLHEPKLDGYRAIAVVDKSVVDIYSRNGLSLNMRFPEIVKEFNYKDQIVFDGEIVAFNEQGCPDFSLLRHGGHAILYYYIFDILFYKRTNLTRLSLEARKNILKDVIKTTSHIKELFFVDDNGAKFYDKVISLGFEGMVSKHKNSKYLPGTRTLDWLKMKNTNTLDLYVIGYIPDDHGTFKSLMLSQKKGSVYTYLGNVGTGFNALDKKMISEQFIPSKKPESLNNYTDIPTATFVEPNMIAEIGFLEKTRDGRLRHPIFRRIRDDK